MSPTRRLAVTDVGRFASGEVSGNVDREWRLATHSSRCRDRRARRGPGRQRPSVRAGAAVDRTTLASDRRIAGAHILAQGTKVVR